MDYLNEQCIEQTVLVLEAEKRCIKTSAQIKKLVLVLGALFKELIKDKVDQFGSDIIASKRVTVISKQV